VRGGVQAEQAPLLLGPIGNRSRKSKFTTTPLLLKQKAYHCHLVKSHRRGRHMIDGSFGTVTLIAKYRLVLKYAYFFPKRKTRYKSLKQLVF